MFNDLTPEMQERLDKWKANILSVKSSNTLRKKSPGNFVSRRGDYGDDTRDIEQDDQKNTK